MSKVLKGTIVVISLLILAVVVLNFYLAGVMVEHAREGLEDLNKDEVRIQYGKITASPIGRRITLKEARLFVEEIDNYTCEEISVTLSWGQMIEIIRNEKIEELKEMNLLAKKIIIGDDQALFSIGSMSFSFSGLINQEIIDGNTELLLKTPQKLSVAFTDFNIELSEFLEEEINLGKMSVFDRISFDLAYNPDKKTLEVEDFIVKNEIIDFKALSSCTLIGDEIDSIIPGLFTLKMEGSIDGKNIDFIEDEYGYMSFKDFAFKMDFEMDFSLPEISPVAFVDTKISDIEYRFPDEMKYYLILMGMLSSDTEKIDISNLAYNMNINKEDLYLYATLKSSLFDLDLEMDAVNDTYDPYINFSTLKISNISRDGESIIDFLELMLEDRLPRDKQSNIIIEYSGYLSELGEF